MKNTQEIHENKNFHFQGVETQDDGNWHFISIGEYGVGSNTLVDPDGVLVPDNSWVNVGQTMFERKSDNWDTTIQEEYFTEAVAENLDTIDGWEDVDQIQVSTNSWRNEAIRWRDEVETESRSKSGSTKKSNDGLEYNQFLGIMEKRDGFIE